MTITTIPTSISGISVVRARNISVRDVKRVYEKVTPFVGQFQLVSYKISSMTISRLQQLSKFRYRIANATQTDCARKEDVLVLSILREGVEALCHAESRKKLPIVLRK